MDATAFDSFPAGLVILDPDGAIVESNAVFAGWVGAAPTGLLGSSFGDFVSRPQPLASSEDEYLPGIAELSRADGTVLPVLVSTSDRDTGRRHIVLFDATEQRAFREKLGARHALRQRTQTRLELVIASAIAFSETTSEQELTDVLVKTMVRAYAAEEAVVFLLDGGTEFQQVAGVNPFGDDAASTLTRQLLGSRAVLKVSGVAAAYEVAPALGEAFQLSGVQSIIVAPIHDGDRTIGILAAFFHHPRTFDEEAAPLADALAGQAARAITALRLQAQLAHAATHDDTTGLPNRRLLEEYFDSPATDLGTVTAVMFVDLDGFKSVNDQLGHLVGDAILREVGSRLQGAVRDQDIVARYGGDEFVIVCEVNDETAALEIAERIRTSIRAPYSSVPHPVSLAASIGVSVTGSGTASAGVDQLVRQADQAMYRAKYAGGDRVVSSAN